MFFSASSLKVEAFFAQYKLIRYKKDEILFRADDAPPGAYYLKSGFVKQYVVSSEGSELILHIYGPGSFFPMMWVIGELPNKYFYTAMTACTTFRAPMDKTAQFLRENPDVVFDLTKRLYLGIEGLLQRIEDLSLGTAYTQVISVLLYLTRHFGKKRGKGIVIPYKFTHQDIAAIMGTVRETTTRELDKLMKEKLILYEKHSIVIPDINRLRKEHTFRR